MYEFNYHRVSSVAEASGAMAGSEDAKYLAGGMTLIPTMKQRLARPTDLVDLSGVRDLTGIERNGQSVDIRAMTSHATVAASAVVRQAIPSLAALASGIGDPQVRNRGTIGGSIANADPAADYPAAVLALGATIHTDSRSIEADEFFTDMFETALEEQEIITRVSFPVPNKAAYVKFPNPASRYAIVGVMVALFDDGPRVAVTGAGPSVFRVTEMERALASDFAAAAIDGLSIADDELNEDIHASAQYRAHLVGVMAKRAVAAAE